MRIELSEIDRPSSAASSVLSMRSDELAVMDEVGEGYAMFNTRWTWRERLHWKIKSPYSAYFRFKKNYRCTCIDLRTDTRIDMGAEVHTGTALFISHFSGSTCMHEHRHRACTSTDTHKHEHEHEHTPRTKTHPSRTSLPRIEARCTTVHLKLRYRLARAPQIES